MRVKWKKPVFCLAVMILGLAIVGTETSAHYVAEKKSYNVITTSLLAMELVEETAEGTLWPAEGVSGMIPGVAVDQVVYVENRGMEPIFVRIMLDKQLIPAEGSGVQADGGLLSLNLNTLDWTEFNGFYYYNRILQRGEKTEPLFTTVTLAPEAGNAYMNATAQIRVLAQAAQSKNNGIDPLFALGWPEASMSVQALSEMQ